MDPTGDELRALVDRDRIRHCVERLARGEDRRDAALISASLWPDLAVDYGMFKGNFEEYLAWVVPGADAITNTQHALGQTYIELDGDKARAETHVLSYHRIDMGEREGDSMVAGRYLDVFEKRNGEWRIAQRIMLYDWYQDWGDAVDWAQGMMGMPFSQEWFSGRAKGDYSVKFFAGKGDL